MSKILIYGSSGWLGGLIIAELLKTPSGRTIICGTARIDNYTDVSVELDYHSPTHVINAAGLTGRPNVDWCEDHPTETMRINTIAAGVLADECYKRQIHLTYVGSGCIYEYNNLIRIEEPSERGFRETEPANFTGSLYSRSKTTTEGILKEYPNVLILRPRMPVSSFMHCRSFLTKLLKSEHVVNVPNSITVLDDFVPLIPQMIERGCVGIYNFTNPGVVTHNELLEMYKKYIDPSFTWKNFGLEDQALILKAGRSNCRLDSGKLAAEFPLVEIHESLENMFKKMSTVK
jgi:3,5-epimerase/4-reductase